jgi:colanic acid/amylovoran biosynthesis glycosyltransferase
VTAVGHVISHYLPRSETFVYTQLRFQRRFRPVVLATHVTNFAEFPHGPIVELLPGRRDTRRIRRKLKALASGHYRYYDRRLALEANRQGCRVLHAHFGGVGRIALPARRRLDLPLVTTFYGRDLAEPSEHYADLFAEGRAFIT